MPLPVRSLRLTASRSSRGYDVDAATYIRSVENADGQTLEPAVKAAINAFVLGCKADGIWTAIKASCVLMGARTLSGALTPLVGSAPTNNNFVSGDYNRKTGLLGNGTTKSLDTNRNNDADPVNSFHLSAYVTALGNIGGWVIGDRYETGWSAIYLGGGTPSTWQLPNRNINPTGISVSTGFVGTSRAASTSYGYRRGGTSFTQAFASQAVTTRRLRAFASSGGTGGAPAEWGSHRVAFYSIGESVNLAQLDTRVSDLYNAITAATP
jgi:hypothetical protein